MTSFVIDPFWQEKKELFLRPRGLGVVEGKLTRVSNIDADTSDKSWTTFSGFHLPTCTNSHCELDWRWAWLIDWSRQVFGRDHWDIDMDTTRAALRPESHMYVHGSACLKVHHFWHWSWIQWTWTYFTSTSHTFPLQAELLVSYTVHSQATTELDSTRLDSRQLLPLSLCLLGQHCHWLGHLMRLNRL